MDTLYSLEKWLNEVKEDFMNDEICGVLDICIIDNTDTEIYGDLFTDDLNDDELLFIVEDEDLFIFEKRHLRTIVNLVKNYDIYNRFKVSVNNKYECY